MIAKEIEILFEDKWLLIVNKPAGLPTQSTVDKSRKNLYDILRSDGRWPYLGLHHRLDVPTSGVVLLTKDKGINKSISEDFKNRIIKKTYNCLVVGKPAWTERQVENHLKQIKGRGGKALMQAVLSGGDFASTSFRVLETLNNGALIEALPHTGRMHQIRVHLQGIKFPIFGDALYGKIDSRVSRLMLHACRLDFQHPISKIDLTVNAPLPIDFLSARDILNR